MTFYIMTANLSQGASQDRSLDKISTYISHTDIVFLQEVDQDTNRSNHTNQPQILSQKSGLSYHTFAGADYDGGKTGVAILSRYLLEGVQSYPLNTGAHTHDDFIIKAYTTIGDLYLCLFAAHFPTVTYPQNQKEAAQLARKLIYNEINTKHDITPSAYIFGGDLNISHNNGNLLLLKYITSTYAGGPYVPSDDIGDSYDYTPPNALYCCDRADCDDYILFVGGIQPIEYQAPCWPLNGTFGRIYGGTNGPLTGADLSDHPFYRVEFDKLVGGWV